MIRKAVIDVNEKGTKASAGNVAILSYKSARPTFRCDWPFIFLFKDNISGVVLFAGQLTDPSKLL
jgi:serpin B